MEINNIAKKSQARRGAKVLRPATENATKTAAPVAVVPAAAPVNIYTKAALSLLRLKCPTMRNYLATAPATPTGAALRSGLNRVLAPFESGPENALRVCSSVADFDQAQFDLDMQQGQLPAQPRYSCEQAKADGATCPGGGCILPNGEPAKAPVDVLVWDCNLKAVGHTAIARSVMTSEFGTELIIQRDEILVYDQGVYRTVDDATLANKILPHLGPMGTVKQAETIGTTLRIANVRRTDVITPNPNVICFNNGTLNVGTRQMELHDPAHMLLNKIEHDYDLDAYCPAFLAFLPAIWRDDGDKAEKIAFLQQWFGYLLLADSSMQKMLILKGEGANGKSILMDVARAMVGEKNTVSAMLNRLRLPYVRATMEAKLLNQAADLPKVGIVADGDLKAIISGDPIEASPKFQPSYTIKPYVKMMVATNNMPNSKDTSDGYFRRLIILSFNRRFAEEERTPPKILLQSLIQEMPGIIAWAIRGLYELRAQGRFSIPRSSIQAVQAYQDDISPARIFAEECLEKSGDRTGFLPRDLFMAFRSWCRDRGFDAGNMVTFGRELSVLGFGQRKSGDRWWLVKAKDAGQEYFRAAQIVGEPASAEPKPTAATLELAPAPAAASHQQEAPELQAA